MMSFQALSRFWNAPGNPNNSDTECQKIFCFPQSVLGPIVDTDRNDQTQRNIAVRKMFPEMSWIEFTQSASFTLKLDFYKFLLESGKRVPRNEQGKKQKYLSL